MGDRGFSEIARSAVTRYRVGALLVEVDLEQGTTSSPKKLETTSGQYILRKLSGRAQAELEYRIAERLAGQQVCAEILMSTEGIGWIEMAEGFYNLQHWIESVPECEPLTPDYYELGSKIGRLHAALQGESLSGKPDRFKLADTWASWLTNQTDGVTHGALIQLETHIEACVREEEQPTDPILIHGDLGRWNWVFGKQGARIVDFGEARYGDRHFDLAACLTSTLDISNSQADDHLRALIDGYSSIIAEYNPDRLTSQIRLWNTRGAVALLLQVGINDRVMRYIEQAMNSYEFFAERLQTTKVK